MCFSKLDWVIDMPFPDKRYEKIGWFATIDGRGPFVNPQTPKPALDAKVRRLRAGTASTNGITSGHTGKLKP
jgi:hypothetical protein